MNQPGEKYRLMLSKETYIKCRIQDMLKYIAV